MGKNARAFTMVELLVVIGVIALLITIGLGAAYRVSIGSRENATRLVVRHAEAIIDTYIDENREQLPPAFFSDAHSGSAQYWPMADAVPLNRSRYANDEVIPSMGRFLHVASEESPLIDEMMKQFDAKFVSLVRDLDLDEDIPHVVDAFGNPVRFVHPVFDGGGGDYWDSNNMSLVTGRPEIRATEPGAGPGVLPHRFRRSYRPFDPAGASEEEVGDADEGICRANNPYAYSAGRDGDPGTRSDNVYADRPPFPQETDEFE